MNEHKNDCPYILANRANCCLFTNHNFSFTLFFSLRIIRNIYAQPMVMNNSVKTGAGAGRRWAKDGGKQGIFVIVFNNKNKFCYVQLKLCLKQKKVIIEIFNHRIISLSDSILSTKLHFFGASLESPNTRPNPIISPFQHRLTKCSQFLMVYIFHCCNESVSLTLFKYRCVPGDLWVKGIDIVNMDALYPNRENKLC